MKIAGRKNDGAWYRTNQFIKNLDGDDRTALVDAIKTIASLDAYITGMADLSEQTGATLPDGLADADTYAGILGTTGIPRQVWLGVLTFDTYTRDGNGRYLGDHAAVARRFGIDLRKSLKDYEFGLKALVDIENQRSRNNGNPGGVADGGGAL